MGGSLVDTEAQAIFCFSPPEREKIFFPQQVLHPQTAPQSISPAE